MNREMSAALGRITAQSERFAELLDRLESYHSESRTELHALVREVQGIIRALDDSHPLIAELHEIAREMKPNRLISSKEAADRVAMHYKSLDRLARQGMVRGYRNGAGGNWLYDPVEVVEDVKAAFRYAPESTDAELVEVS